jgi:hypothetical protein
MSHTYTRTFELTDSQFKLLKTIIDEGYIEFRNARYTDEDAIREQDCYVLSSQSLIEQNEMSWHTTFNPTKIGIETFIFLNRHVSAT